MLFPGLWVVPGMDAGALMAMDKRPPGTIELPSNPIAGLVRAGREVFARMPPALFIRTPRAASETSASSDG